MMGQTARQTFEMLENESLWAIARHIDSLLAREGIAYGVLGGVAVSLHGYRRNTIDLDLLIRREDQEKVFSLLRNAGFEWQESRREFAAGSGVAVQFVLAGDAEGVGQAAKFPEPGDSGRIVRIEGLPVLALPRLIEAKLACGLGDMRRMHKDFADVVELIAIHDLDSSFARLLHKSVRKAYRQLVTRVRPE
ncbi:MAG: nucleotidyltransferase family protein [Candidatus Sericytochromatia bacterium]|nr:nucleotidyltransferase family protein [Candidatus Tanganyikabacteria bacterium]